MQFFVQNFEWISFFHTSGVPQPSHGSGNSWQ